ncbi:WPP domain-interacting tail-anchored protein 1-like [Bidens hawaiensis]|uniref:WPP domain-interacting tail-anchored protein 1-like n=1 Tax=Bidens hawaiensis TaxID=980011 RepID=UPI00404AB3A4
MRDGTENGPRISSHSYSYILIIELYAKSEHYHDINSPSFISGLNLVYASAINMDSATKDDASSQDSDIARFVLDAACICDKLTNLNMLSMHVETKETEFEAFAADMDPDLVIKILEYTLLSGFLESEVNLLEAYISDLQIEKDNAMEILFLRKHGKESLTEMANILHGSEISLEHSLEQVSEIKERSANFEKNLVRLSGGDQVQVNEHTDTNMHAVEHHRHVLRMLEESLKREIDLEKRVSELTEIEETLTMRLRLLEQQVLDAEEEAEMNLENYYEKDDTSELLMETCKVLVDKIKMLQLNYEGSFQAENMEDSESYSDLNDELNLVKMKVKSLETSLHDMEETKKAPAKSIDLCSKFISDLVMQMTLERERVQNQVSDIK